MTRRRRPGLVALALGALLGGLTASPAPAHAQAAAGPGGWEDGVRVGVTVGGTGLVGVAVELFRDGRAVEVGLSTWSFRDVGVTVVGKQTFGASSFRPVVGAGAWLAVAWPPEDDPDRVRPGYAFLVRAPIGFDWRVRGDHHLTAALSPTRALWIRRQDPRLDLPVRDRLVPLPLFGWRWAP